jgi:branched-chain amino acid transport system permease protein
LPVFTSDYVTGLLTAAAVYGLAATALGFVVGYGNMISFGHAAFVGTGAYVVLIAQRAGQNEALLVWPIAFVAGALLACAFGAISLRARGAAFIMLTLALAQMMYLLAASVQSLGGVDGVPLKTRNTLAGIALSDPRGFHAVVIVLLLATIAVLLLVTKSPFGRGLSAIGINERRVRALGYDTRRMRILAFTISGGFAGLAGALLANAFNFVSPANLHWLLSGELLVMVALGGLGTVVGPAIGGVLLSLLQTNLATLTDHWRIVLGPLIIVMAVLLRRGIYVWLIDALRRQP